MLNGTHVHISFVVQGVFATNSLHGTEFVFSLYKNDKYNTLYVHQLF